MHLAKTDIGDFCPPVPAVHRIQPVYIRAVPTSSSLRYVFGLIMSGTRGSIGWDIEEQHLVLYMMVEPIDAIHFPDLEVGSEVWACFNLRSKMV